VNRIVYHTYTELMDKCLHFIKWRATSLLCILIYTYIALYGGLVIKLVLAVCRSMPVNHQVYQCAIKSTRRISRTSWISNNDL